MNFFFFVDSSGRDKICTVWDLVKKKAKRTVPVFEVSSNCAETVNNVVEVARPIFVVRKIEVVCIRFGNAHFSTMEKGHQL